MHVYIVPKVPTEGCHFPHSLATEARWESACKLFVLPNTGLQNQNPENIIFYVKTNDLTMFGFHIPAAVFFLLRTFAFFHHSTFLPCHSPWWGTQQPQWHCENVLLCSGCRHWCPDHGVSEQTRLLGECVLDWELQSDPLCWVWSAPRLLLATPTKPHAQFNSILFVSRF